MLLTKYVVMLLVLVTKLPMNKLLVFGSMSPLSESKNKTHDPVHRRFLNLTVGFQSEVDCVVCNATTLTTSPPPPELAGKVPMAKVATVVFNFVPT